MTSDATPPYRPTYNIRLTEDQIRTIVSFVFPGKQLTKSEQLPSGQSFNNRIYFLDVSSDSEGNLQTEQYVLKLAGYYFGATKIQNEVGCLQLLAKYCPDVPTPKVIAWSDHGTEIITVDGRITKSLKSQMPAGSDEESIPSIRLGSWVLQTRLPGRLLDTDDLKGPSGRKIMTSLATIMADWRTKMPTVAHFGNVRYREPSDTLQSTTIFVNLGPGLPDFIVGGWILWYQYTKAPLQSAADFYSCYAEDNLRDLTNNPLLRTLADRIESPVRKFTQQELPQLPILKDRKDTAKFTHFDFAPRNILVDDDDPSIITGILDCEFAGFAPWEEEFVNMQVRQPNDWPEEHYRILVEEVERLEQQASLQSGECIGSISSHHFAQACVLAELIANVRPWYIQDGAHTPDELEKEVDQASAIVVKCMEQLRAAF